jgi:hypothetical protein
MMLLLRRLGIELCWGETHGAIERSVSVNIPLLAGECVILLVKVLYSHVRSASVHG